MQDITREQSHEIKAELKTIIDVKNTALTPEVAERQAAIYEQAVSNGKTSEHNRRQATHMVASLNHRQQVGSGDRFGHSHIYGGTANPAKVNRRRAKNRVAGKSRRINRGE